MPPDHLIVPEEMSRRADVALRALSVNSYFLDLGQAVKRAVEIAGASPCAQPLSTTRARSQETK